MITFSGRTQIHAATAPVDMRKSYDALFAYIRDTIHGDPLSGHIFLFINKSRNRLKALCWDGTGLVILSKRLEERRFTRLNPLHGNSITMTSSEFALLFEGADLSGRFVTTQNENVMVESPKKFKELRI